MPNIDKSFAKIIERYGDPEFWENERNQKAFGKFMDFMRDKYKGLAFDSDESRAIFRLSRYRVDQELIYKNYDLFSNAFVSGEDDAENIKNLRRTGKMLKLETIRNAFDGTFDAIYSIGRNGKRFYNVRDERGRFVKKS